MKNKLTSVKNHVKTNRAKYAAGATATALIALQMRNAKELNEFLAKHDLLDEYYSIEDVS